MIRSPNTADTCTWRLVSVAIKRENATSSPISNVTDWFANKHLVVQDGSVQREQRRQRNAQLLSISILIDGIGAPSIALLSFGERIRYSRVRRTNSRSTSVTLSSLMLREASV